MALMVIFSMGGLAVRRHASPNRLRCRPSVVNVDSSEIDVVLDPWPVRTGQGVVAAGRVRVTETGMERDLRSTPAAGRWDDVDLLEYAARALWSWVTVPLLDDPGPGHRLIRDADGLVVRHEEGEVIHELSGHCDFGGLVVATRRRTHGRHGVPLEWADLVAAHMIPSTPTQPLN